MELAVAGKAVQYTLLIPTDQICGHDPQAKLQILFIHLPNEKFW